AARRGCAVGVRAPRGFNPPGPPSPRPPSPLWGGGPSRVLGPIVAVLVAVAASSVPKVPGPFARWRPSSGAWRHGCSAPLSSPWYGQAPPARRGCVRAARSAMWPRCAWRRGLCVVDPGVADLGLAKHYVPGAPVLGPFDRAPAPGGEHQVVVRPRAGGAPGLPSACPLSSQNRLGYPAAMGVTSTSHGPLP